MEKNEVLRFLSCGDFSEFFFEVNLQINLQILSLILYITTHLLPIHRDYVWDSTRRASPVGLALTSTAVLSRSIRSCFPYLFGVIDVWKKVRVQCWINLLSVILLLLLSPSVSPPPVLPPCSFLFFFLVSSSSLHIH